MTRTILVIALFASFAATACIKSPLEGQNPPYEVEPTLGDFNYATIRVFFATDRDRRRSTRPSDMFGFDRGPVTYGTCDVSIPRDHRMGVLESPSFLKLEFHGDPEKHVLLLRISIENKQKYFADVAARIRDSSKKNALIFVHGYNVTFEDAARRTGQMAYDLGFEGAPVFYSWPSQGSFTGYLVDETNNEWTQNNLKHFLDDFASQADAQSIFLIAHSMGSRALTRAFGQLIREKPILRNRFREIILSAPDIDAEVFRRDIASQIIPATLYASSGDEALKLSKKFHGYARAGDAGGGLVIVPGIDTVDASSVATDFVGHSYFAESRSIISDMFYLIKDGKRARDRFGLQGTDTPTGRYWVLKP
jgi:esterase/lipase superfamily enzyme